MNVLLGHLNDMLRQPLPQYDFQNISEEATPPVELARHLIDTMKAGNGIGLAANQIGVPARVFCMQTEPPMVCFNPTITWYSNEEVLLDEACLSYPGVSVKVKRPQHIRAKFQDPYGNVVVKKFTGLAARVFQHELDHLDGIEFWERAGYVHRDRFKNKWKKVVRTLKKHAASR